MNQEIIKKLLKSYKVDYVSIGEMQTGYRNKSYQIVTSGGKILNLIIYKSEPGILERVKRADTVSEAAARAGYPARERYSNKTATLVSPSGKVHYARLYEYLPGKTIPWEAYSKKHIKLLGAAMSDIHFAVKDLDIDLPLITLECSTLNTQMRSYFDKYGVRSALSVKLGLITSSNMFEEFNKVLSVSEKLPNQIPLHMDMVRGNILYGSSPSPKKRIFSRSKKQVWQIDDLVLTGVIDFEKTARGNIVFDLARTYAFLMVDCQQKQPADIYKYLVHSGYNKRGKNQVELSGDLLKLFHKLVDFYLFYDFYKFLLHNPYESLKENHHFCLTRDILLSKNMLKSL